MSSSTTSPPSSNSFQSLLSSTLETIFHQLLYSRSVYPPDSFVLHRHLGVRCHASRVPAVGDYISEFIRVAVPAVIAGIGDELSFVVLEEELFSGSGGGGGGERTGGTKTLERFVFQFHVEDVIRANCGDSNADMDIIGSREQALKLDTQLATDAKIQLERSMRECLLRLLAFRGRRRKRGEKAENLSFKLCMHVRNSGEDEKRKSENSADGPYQRCPKSCPELIKALNQGDWFMPEESSVLFSSSPAGTMSNANDNNMISGGKKNHKGLLQPIKSVHLPSCGMRMQMGMEAYPF